MLGSTVVLWTLPALGPGALVSGRGELPPMVFISWYAAAIGGQLTTPTVAAPTVPQHILNADKL